MLRGERSVLSWLQSERSNVEKHSAHVSAKTATWVLRTLQLSPRPQADTKSIGCPVPSAAHVRNIRPFTFATAWQFLCNVMAWGKRAYRACALLPSECLIVSHATQSAASIERVDCQISRSSRRGPARLGFQHSRLVAGFTLS